MKFKLDIKDRWQRFKVWREQPSQIAPLLDEWHECECCHTNYQGNFCPRCSQSSHVGRYSFKTAVLGFLDVWGLGNRGMFRTIRDLILRPGYMIRDYLNGMQAAYFPPFKMFFVLAVFSILVTHGLNIKGESYADGNDKLDAIEQAQRDMETERQNAAYQTTSKDEDGEDSFIDDMVTKIGTEIVIWAIRWGLRFPNIVSLLLLMSISGVLYLFFRHSPNISDLRFSEFFVSLVYANNMYSIYSIVFGFFCLSTLSSWSILLIIIPLKQLSGYSWWKTILKVVVAFSIMVALFYLIITIFVLILMGYVVWKY